MLAFPSVWDDENQNSKWEARKNKTVNQMDQMLMLAVYHCHVVHLELSYKPLHLWPKSAAATTVGITSFVLR